MYCLEFFPGSMKPMYVGIYVNNIYINNRLWKVFNVFPNNISETGLSIHQTSWGKINFADLM